jgi:hypothetical protein
MTRRKPGRPYQPYVRRRTRTWAIVVILAALLLIIGLSLVAAPR